MARLVAVAGLLIVVAVGVLWIQADSAPQGPQLGPADGFDLAPTDIERVAVGQVAPDFTLEAYRGGTVTLSDLRGETNVVLVFYRGHW